MAKVNPLAVHPDPGSIRTGREARLFFRRNQGAPFTQTTRLDGDFASVAAGVNVLWRNDMTLQLGFSGQYADTWDSSGAYAKVSFGF